MKMITTVLLIILSSAVASASYQPTRLDSLIHSADLIAEGSIAQVEEEYFLLGVNAVIKGECLSAVIRIKKFENRACARRFAAYARGQKLIVFLKQQPQGFNLIGKGDEGEMPVVAGAVYYKVPETEVAPFGHIYHPYGGRLRGYKYRMEAVKQAIAYLLRQEGSTTLPEPVGNPVMKRIKREMQAIMVRVK